MQVTSVSITLVNQGKLRGYVSIGLDDSLLIHGLKIIERDEGLFVSMPSRKRQDGTFADIVHPINPQTREMIEHAVLIEYQRVIANSGRFVPRST
jgi:stage V sporulation protein G